MKRGVRICLSFDRRRRQKLKERIVRGLGWAENWEKQLSEASDEWKIEKNVFPTPRRAKKMQKTLVVGWRNAEIARKRSSSVDETRKMQKNARRRLTKRRNREKTLIVDRRNAKNVRKCPSSADEMQKAPKNSLSYPYDEQKTLKTAFRRGTINKKRRKSAFRYGGWVENSKNSVSATAESEKIEKIDFPPWPKA